MLKATRRWRPLCVESHYALNATMRWRFVHRGVAKKGYALKVGMRWCIEEWPRGPCVHRLSGDGVLGNCNTQNRGYALLKPCAEGMHRLDQYIEMKWRLSRWYIYKWTEYSIILITFQSSSWSHFEAKQRREVEEGVYVGLGWNSRRFRGGNLSWNGEFSWCYLIWVSFSVGGRTNCGSCG